MAHAVSLLCSRAFARLQDKPRDSPSENPVRINRTTKRAWPDLGHWLADLPDAAFTPLCFGLPHSLKAAAALQSANESTFPEHSTNPSTPTNPKPSEGTEFNPAMSADTGILDEFTSKPIFWILGFLVIVSWIVTIITIPSQAPSSYYTRQPHWTRWLTPYVTSRPRQLLFALLHLGVFGTQVLMVRWVAITGFRWIQAMFDLWPAQGGWAMHSLYSVSTIVLILMVVGAVLVGVFMAVCQFLCVLELMLFHPDGGRGEKQEKR